MLCNFKSGLILLPRADEAMKVALLGLHNRCVLLARAGISYLS